MLHIPVPNGTKGTLVKARVVSSPDTVRIHCKHTSGDALAPAIQQERQVCCNVSTVRDVHEATALPAGLTLQGACPAMSVLACRRMVQKTQRAERSMIARAALLHHVGIWICGVHGCQHVT